MSIKLTEATAADAVSIAELRTAAAEHLTREFGQGHWSSGATERGVLYNLRNARVFVARDAGRVLGTLSLQTKKPWAIDKSYFSNSKKPLYLTAMAVDPASQRKGIGRAIMKEAQHIARAWPADAIRLDAYDAIAGAGAFYAKCGLREVGRVSYREVPLIYYEMML